MVLAADVPPHDVMAQEIKATWGAFKSDKFRTIYYWGQMKGEKELRKEPLMKGDDLYLGIKETIYAVTHKTLEAYKYVIDKLDFDYVFRCCSGCYVVPKLLLDFVAPKPREKEWCGITDTTSFSHPFVSGSGMLLSRDLVQMIVDNYKKIMAGPYPQFMDDVNVAWLLTQNGIQPDQKARRVDDKTNLVPGCYHYHFRTNLKSLRTIHEKILEQERAQG